MLVSGSSSDPGGKLKNKQADDGNSLPSFIPRLRPLHAKDRDAGNCWRFHHHNKEGRRLRQGYLSALRAASEPAHPGLYARGRIRTPVSLSEGRAPTAAEM